MTDAAPEPEPAPEPTPDAAHEPVAETTTIADARGWQEAHERFQRGLLHRGGRYVWAHPGAPSWRVGSVGVLRPAGQAAERLWMVIPLPHLLAPERLRDGILMHNTVVALPTSELPSPEAIADMEARADIPIVAFSSAGVAAGPRAEATDVANELRATLAYDAGVLAAVDPTAAFAKLEELEQERQFHQKLRADMPRTWVTNAIAGALVAVWLVQVASGFPTENPSPITQLDWGACQAGLIHSEPWRLVTAGFLHYGLLHLGFNAFGTVVLGRITERLYGRFAFAALFLLSVVGALLASCAWNPFTIAAGASGGVFGIFGAIVGFALRRRSDLPQRVFRRLAGIVALLIALNLGLTIWLSVTLPIDNAGHVGGLLLGFVAGFLLARPLPANRRPSGNQLLAAAGLVLALVGGYFGVRALPAVVQQRVLWDDGVTPLVHRTLDAVHRLQVLADDVDPAALAEIRSAIDGVRRDAALASAARSGANEDSRRALSAVVNATEVLSSYLRAVKFGESGTVWPPAEHSERVGESLDRLMESLQTK